MSSLDMLQLVRSVFALGASPNGASAWPQLVIFAVVLGIFYFIVLMPMRQKQRKAQEFIEALKVGDRVITTGGIYGQVTRLAGDTVQLQIADKVRIEIARAAIGGYQGQPPVVESPSQ